LCSAGTVALPRMSPAHKHTVLCRDRSCLYSRTSMLCRDRSCLHSCTSVLCRDRSCLYSHTFVLCRERSVATKAACARASGWPSAPEPQSPCRMSSASTCAFACMLVCVSLCTHTHTQSYIGVYWGCRQPPLAHLQARTHEYAGSYARCVRRLCAMNLPHIAGA